MLTQYHAAITRKALKNHFSPITLDEIVSANLGQDDLLTGQIGHDEYHFDNNAFEQSYAYMEEQRALALTWLQHGDASAARAAFGRLTHTAQDFYAHSNYVDLWLAQFDKNPPPPGEIDPLVEELIRSPDLHSGKLYYPLEIFSFLPVAKKFVIPLLPKDSHAHMNLDSPEKGLRFAYAFEAAVKRTRFELDGFLSDVPANTQASFLGIRENQDR
ncbi:MAG: hypothetical protein Kow002_02020 [Anaerolineales bacterium]